MLVYIGKIYRSVASGRARKRVVCEQCHTTYHYEMVRVGVGHGHSAYMLDASSAASRASERAEGDVTGMLLEGCEPVPCPKCGWFQGDMVELMRQEYWRPMQSNGIVIAAISIVILAAALLLESVRLWDSISYLASAGIVLGVAMIALRMLLAGRYEPNARYPKMPDIPPGSPPALLEDAVGRETVAGAWARPPQVVDGWIAHRLAADPFAPICCRCLAPADKTFRPPLQTHSNVPVPLCRRCSKLKQILWWVYTLATLALTGAGSWYVAQLSEGIDFVGQILMAVMVWIFAGVIGVALIPTLLTRPFKVKVLSGRRHVYWLKFRNARYASLLARWTGDRIAARAATQSARAVSSGT